jgi:hypothetical protein
LAAIIGGVLLLISDLLGLAAPSGSLSEAATTTSYAVNNGLRILGGIALLLGLVGLYVGQSEASGPLGLVGFLAAFAGTSLILGTSWTNTFVAPSVATEAPAFLDAGPTGALGFGFTLSYALAALGWLLFGLISFRARVYPRAATVALIAGAVLTFAPLPASGVVFNAAVLWLGLSLFSQKETFARETERVK